MDAISWLPRGVELLEPSLANFCGAAAVGFFEGGGDFERWLAFYSVREFALYLSDQGFICVGETPLCFLGGGDLYGVS